MELTEREIDFLEFLKKGNKIRLIEMNNNGIVRILSDSIEVVGFDHQKFRSNDKLDKCFDDFYFTYPRMVEGRVLRTSAKNTSFYKKMKVKFKQKIPAEDYDKVVIGLKKELEIKEKENNLKFLQGMETYINQCTYEKYLNLEESETTSNSSSAGFYIETTETGIEL